MKKKVLKICIFIFLSILLILSLLPDNDTQSLDFSDEKNEFVSETVTQFDEFNDKIQELITKQEDLILNEYNRNEPNLRYLEKNIISLYGMLAKQKIEYCKYVLNLKSRLSVQEIEKLERMMGEMELDFNINNIENEVKENDEL